MIEIKPGTCIRFTSGDKALTIPNNTGNQRVNFNVIDGENRFPGPLLNELGDILIPQAGFWNLRFGAEVLGGHPGGENSYGYISTSLEEAGNEGAAPNMQDDIDPAHGDTFSVVEVKRYYAAGAVISPLLALYNSAENGVLPGELKQSTRHNLLEIEYVGA